MLDTHLHSFNPIYCVNCHLVKWCQSTLALLVPMPIPLFFECFHVHCSYDSSFASDVTIFWCTLTTAQVAFPKWGGDEPWHNVTLDVVWQNTLKTTDVNTASHLMEASGPLIWKNLDINKELVALNTLHNNHYKSFTWPLCNKPLLRRLKDHLQERLGRSLGTMHISNCFDNHCNTMLT